ncbi:TRM11 family SAM-dependent methyltransferase [Thaumasiovibrio subtropicus]|uniref:TRM11 family SAM-dependent methyltransferase n=1 Tax=Thaumasiovibrio subtropicus TaxID=1891207 RepID=UPI000B34DFAF|nr:DNA methylase [Thaumasiovibrio subtropicus]
MPHYAILANPGHNRIYFDTALTIGCAELTALLTAKGVAVKDVAQKEIGVPAAICFSTDAPLSESALTALAASSLYYALFELLSDGLLKPITPPSPFTFPESMSQILRYTGKTNEQFTRLMINLAYSAAETNSDRLCLMDPMCGKGTTLYEGLIRGFDVIGVEINNKWVHETEVFLTKYMKQGRFKHKAKKEKRTGSNGKKLADCFVLDCAADKDAFNQGAAQNLKLLAIDTRESHQVIKKNSCDMLVSDLPYGVQHGSKNAKAPKMERSPLELLSEALPSWKQTLKSKGAIVLSFNEFTLKWKEAAVAFEQAGFIVKDEAPYVDYLHRVDQSINRNVIVAVKP